MLRIGVWAALGAIGIGGLVGGGQAAQAADTQQEVDRLIRHGIELRRARDDEAAAQEFEKAYRLAPTPRAAAQLGLAKQALGLWEEAERYVAEAIGAAGKDPWISKNRGALDEALGTIQKHLGRVEVIGDPAGAEISINGRRAGKLPMSAAARVSVGDVYVDARAPGYVPAQRTVTLVGGQYQRVVIHLARLETPHVPAAVVVPVPPASAVVAEPAPRPASSVPLDTTEAGPSTTRVALTWTAAGLAVAGLATGTVGVLLHSSKVSEFDNHPCRNKNGSGVLLDGTPDSTCQSLLDSFRSDQKVAIVGFLAAGAFAATWLALFLTEPSRAERPVEQAALHATCVPAGPGVALSCAVRF